MAKLDKDLQKKVKGVMKLNNWVLTLERQRASKIVND